MFNIKFTQEAVLETCSAQCLTLEKAGEDSEQSILEYDEQFVIFKNNREDWRNLDHELNRMRFSLEKSLGNGVNDKEEIVIINTKIEEMFNNNIKLNCDITNISQQFNDKSRNMAEQEQNLVTQFAENTVNESIAITEQKLNTVNDSEQQLITSYEKLHTSEIKENIYLKVDGLPVVIEELRLNKNENVDSGKLAEKEKNIAFLITAFKSNKEKIDPLSENNVS